MFKLLNIICKILATFILIALFILVAFSISPIFDFSPGEPFKGEKIYNPYSNLDSTAGWKKAVLHTHTKVDKGINECPYYPDVVYEDYMAYDYDIVGFSNHQALTAHPVDTALQMNIYEHGYNILKFHKLVFGSDKVCGFDHLLPILDSQRQWMIDILCESSDIVAFNHPDRSGMISSSTMAALSGYRLIEGDSSIEEHDGGSGTALKHWDEALSAGRYSHNMANDDNHDSKNLQRMARRCNWINTPSPRYEDVKKALMEGNFFSMRIPDYGEGDYEVKVRCNRSLPEIRTIGLRRDSILYMTLSAPASVIKVISQDGVTVDSVLSASSVEYAMKGTDPYIRFTARYEDGLTIYSNAFARYDEGDTPFRVFEHPVNIPLTVLFNLTLALTALFLLRLICRLWRKTASSKKHL